MGEIRDAKFRWYTKDEFYRDHFFFSRARWLGFSWFFGSLFIVFGFFAIFEEPGPERVMMYLIGALPIGSMFFMAARNEWKMLKLVRSLKGHFIPCNHCHSRFPREMVGNISQLLIRLQVPHRLVVDQDMSLFLPREWNKTRYDAGPYANFLLEDLGLGICFIKVDQGHDGSLWLFLGKISNSSSRIDIPGALGEIKQQIERSLEKISGENPFCIQCNGDKQASCYGSPYFTGKRGGRYGQDREPWAREMWQLQLTLDPYQDETILREMVKRKGKSPAEDWANEEGEEKDLRDFLARLENRSQLEKERDGA